MTVQRFITLDAEDLLSKWGFGDGDVIHDIWWDWFGEDINHSQRDDILYAIIMEYLVPAMSKAGLEVEIFKIDTNHNPVRASHVNGVEIESHTDDRYDFDPPVTVEVSAHQIYELVNAMIIKEN